MGQEKTEITIPDFFLGRDDTATIGEGTATYAVYSGRENRHEMPVRTSSNVLIYLLEGTKILHTDKEDIAIHPGNAVFLKRGSYCMSEILAESGEPYRAVLLFYSDRVLLDFLSRYPDTLQNIIPQEESDLFYVAADETMRRTIESIIPYFSSDSSHAADIVALKFEEIFLHLLGLECKERFRYFLFQMLSSQQVAFSRLFDQADEPIESVEEMIRLSRLPRAKFYEAFQTYYGVAPKKWLDEKRLESAKRRLAVTTDPVTTIAQDVGYQSSSWFAQRFKERYGRTPSQYRQAKTDND